MSAVRFLLDNMVDYAVLGCLMSVGHKAFPIAEVGTANAKDDLVAVVGRHKDAVVITHDREFALRQRRNTWVRMIHMTCDEWEVCNVLEEYLDELLPILEGRPYVVIRCGLRDYTVHKPRWS